MESLKEYMQKISGQHYRFFKAFGSIHRGKMKQILLTYVLSKETVTTMMMLYKNMKAMVHSADGDTDFFNILIEVL